MLKDLELVRAKLVVEPASSAEVASLEEMLLLVALIPMVKLFLDVKLMKVHPIEPENRYASMLNLRCTNEKLTYAQTVNKIETKSSKKWWGAASVQCNYLATTHATLLTK